MAAIHSILTEGADVLKAVADPVPIALIGTPDVEAVIETMIATAAASDAFSIGSPFRKFGHGS